MILIGDITEQPVDSRTESALSEVKQTRSLSESCSRNVILPEDQTLSQVHRSAQQLQTKSSKSLLKEDVSRSVLQQRQ